MCTVERLIRINSKIFHTVCPVYRGILISGIVLMYRSRVFGTVRCVLFIEVFSYLIKLPLSLYTCIHMYHDTLFFRRKAYQTHDGSSFVSCLGKSKPKKKILYSSHHSGEFEAYDIVLYEPVILKENFQYGTLVLIGRWREGVYRGEGGPHW